MQRDIDALASRQFDIIIVGGGILGACLAWDATLRGFSVALVDKGDFGHATSANSLKIVHGGLRYLQNGNVKLARQMARERHAFLTIAPHLVHPLACVVPTNNSLKRNPLIMRGGIFAADLISLDRTRVPGAERRLPHGKHISRHDLQQLAPQLDLTDANGAAVWHDAQMVSSERLTLAFVHSAESRGAKVANYVAIGALLHENGRVIGVEATDSLSGRQFDMHGQLVINAAGIGLRDMIPGGGAYGFDLPIRPTLAMNFVIKRRFADVALALPTRPQGNQKSRLLFLTPWHDVSIVGTAHFPLENGANERLATDRQIDTFLAELNGALPADPIRRAEIEFVHQGVLPAWDDDSAENIRLVRDGQIIDHVQHDGTRGLISVLSVKYTAARLLAEHTIDLAATKLQRGKPSQTRTTPLWGNEFNSIAALHDHIQTIPPTRLQHDALTQLTNLYGNKTDRVLALLELENDAQAGLIAAQTRYAVREEMAVTLADVILRRTDIGTRGRPDPAIIAQVAQTMQQELGWQHDRVAAELAALDAVYARMTAIDKPLGYSQTVA
jgi:glycerol-3-phosphate dehydrogenase